MELCSSPPLHIAIGEVNSEEERSRRLLPGELCYNEGPLEAVHTTSKILIRSLMSPKFVVGYFDTISTPPRNLKSR